MCPDVQGDRGLDTAQNQSHQSLHREGRRSKRSHCAGQQGTKEGLEKNEKREEKNRLVTVHVLSEDGLILSLLQ